VSAAPWTGPPLGADGLLAGLAPFLLLGLAGGLHCAGMCGPFALAVGGRPGPTGRTGRAWPALATYVVGKALAYALIAALIAATAGALAATLGEPGWLRGFRTALAWAAAVAMVLVALPALGVPWITWWIARGAPGPFARVAALLHRVAGELATPWRGFGLGFANGFLPCGLSGSAVALAAATEPRLVLLGPLAFGLATAPVLVAVGASGAAVPLALRTRLRRGAALLLLAFAGWTAWRGWPAPEGAAGGPPCCDPPAVEGAARTPPDGSGPVPR